MSMGLSCTRNFATNLDESVYDNLTELPNPKEMNKKHIKKQVDQQQNII